MVPDQTNKNRNGWLSVITGGKKGLVIFAGVAVIAFALGMMFGGGEGGNEGAANTEQAAAEESTIWTCSMHPQIKLPKAGKCPICLMNLIPLDTGSDDEGERQLRMSESAVQLARISTSPVTRDFAEAEVRMFGRITYDESRLSRIAAWVPGRLDRLYADYTGMTVNKGEHLAYIYSPELLASQEELIQALRAMNSMDEGSAVLQRTATATVAAVREKLRLYGLTAEQISKIEATGEASDHLTIYAPVGGVVVELLAREGTYVKTGTPLYSIADLSKLWVLFDAYETDLPWLRYGQEVSFTSLSFPGEVFTGTITFINPVLDARTRTIKVRAVVDNSSGRLKPEMFVSGTVLARLDKHGQVIDLDLAGKWIGPMHPEIIRDGPGDCDICGMPLVPIESLGYAVGAKEKEPPLLIPASAPLITGKRAVVYVQLDDNDGPIFEGRVVVLGPRAGDFYVVKSGLQEGERVVTNGAFKIDAELQIRAKPSMMSPDGGGSTPGHDHGGHEQASAPAHEQQKEDAVERESVSQAALAALSPVYEAYFVVQMGLAADDLDGAIEGLRQLEDEVGKVDMTLFEGKGHMTWMDFSGKLKASSAAGTKAGDLKEARSEFLTLSKVILKMHDTFGHGGGDNFYLTYCPMANDNKGAHWLQTMDTVYNSHYGAMMLRCGEIQDTLEPGRLEQK